MAIDLHTYLGLSWFMQAICTTLVITRLVIRVRQRQTSYWVCELFLVLGLLCFIASTVGDTVILSNIPGADGAAYGKMLLQWAYATVYLFDLGQYWPRFSLLAFYHKLFPISESKLRIGLYIVSAYVTCSFVATGLINIFWCGLDIKQNWSLGVHECSVMFTKSRLLATWPLAISSELLILLLPFPVLRKLNFLTWRERVGLMCIFLLGLCTIVVGLIRFVLAMREVPFTLDICLVYITEFATGIMVVALPPLRPLLGKLSSWPLFTRSKPSSTGDSNADSARKPENMHSLGATDTAPTEKDIRDSSQSYNSAEQASRNHSRQFLHQTAPEPWENLTLPPYLK